MASKYMNQIFDGARKVIKTTRMNSHTHYLLENIFNQRTCLVSSTDMFFIANSKTSVASIIASRIKKNTRRKGLYENNAKTTI